MRRRRSRRSGLRRCHPCASRRAPAGRVHEGSRPQLRGFVRGPPWRASRCLRSIPDDEARPSGVAGPRDRSHTGRARVHASYRDQIPARRGAPRMEGRRRAQNHQARAGATTIQARDVPGVRQETRHRSSSRRREHRQQRALQRTSAVPPLPHAGRRPARRAPCRYERTPEAAISPVPYLRSDDQTKGPEPWKVPSVRRVLPSQWHRQNVG